MRARPLIALAVAAGAALGSGLGWWLAPRGPDAARLVATHERVQVVDGPIGFLALMDSGATVSSIHARDVEVIDGDATDPARNLGRTVRFTLENEAGRTVTLERPVALVKRIRTGDCREWRYHVRLEVEFRGERRRILVNLNDRGRAPERLLLGRNWLGHGYVIAVAPDEVAL